MLFANIPPSLTLFARSDMISYNIFHAHGPDETSVRRGWLVAPGAMAHPLFKERLDLKTAASAIIGDQESARRCLRAGRLALALCSARPLLLAGAGAKRPEQMVGPALSGLLAAKRLPQARVGEFLFGPSLNSGKAAARPADRPARIGHVLKGSSEQISSAEPQ
jgi:hypothetical protein